jgi:hypothetical protein
MICLILPIIPEHPLLVIGEETNSRVLASRARPRTKKEQDGRDVASGVTSAERSGIPKPGGQA